MATRIQIAKADIVKYFNGLPKKILDSSEIGGILEKQREFWRLAQSTTTNELIRFLVEKSDLRIARFDFPSRPIIKYLWGDVPLYAVVLSLKPACYLSHYTAMHLHELTDQIPKVINVNAEQTPKPRYAGDLTQERIDFAFGRATRLSHNIAEYEGNKIRLLNGQHTRCSGVMEMPGPEGEMLRVTDIERTLIDIAVRPEYAGGVFEVLGAYKRARGRVSVNRLTALFKGIGYLYPYHQVIGFYLQTAGGYAKTQINLLKKFEIKYNFYLMHQIENAAYSSEWRLYYPEGLN